MPLWEGFDEPWHYGYVQTLASGHLLPVLGRARFSEEIRQSLLLAPVSHVMQKNWPELQSFDRYFRLTPEARADQRRKLEQIPRDTTESAGVNYEIQQPPLAYAVLAPIGFVLQKSLSARPRPLASNCQRADLRRGHLRRQPVPVRNTRLDRASGPDWVCFVFLPARCIGPPPPISPTTGSPSSWPSPSSPPSRHPFLMLRPILAAAPRPREYAL